MKYRHAISAILATCLLSASLRCEGINKPVARITIDQARKLVMAALPHEMASLPGLYLDYYSIPDCTDFYYFAVLWRNPMPEGSNLSAHIAVDSLTCEVWDPFLAKRYESPKLKKLQKSMRELLGLSDADYQKLRERYPC